MKKKCFLIILFGFISLNSFSQYDFESKVIECFQVSGHPNGIDLFLEKDSIENYLLENRFLQGTTGKDYKALLHELNANPLQLVEILSQRFALIQEESIHSSLFYNCISNLQQRDSLLFQSSRLHEITKQLANLNDLEKSNLLSLFDQLFTPEDLDEPFYQLYTYQILSMVSTKSYLIKDLATRNLNQSPVLEFDMTAQSKIYFAGKVITLKQISKEVTTFLKQDMAFHFIKVNAKRETKVTDFVKLMDTISTTYDAFIHDKSLEIYSIAYEKLTETQQSALKERYHFEIIEGVLD
jgi:hypothetical protein